MQSQNMSIHNRNEHMPTFTNVVTHDGRWELMPTHQGVNKGTSNIENKPQRQNKSILRGVKHEDCVTLYVKIEWTHSDSYESMKRKFGCMLKQSALE